MPRYILALLALALVATALSLAGFGRAADLSAEALFGLVLILLLLTIVHDSDRPRP